MIKEKIVSMLPLEEEEQFHRNMMKDVKSISQDAVQLYIFVIQQQQYSG